MRSLLLSRLSRLYLSKPPALGVRHLGGARFLSETPLCRIVRAEHCGDTLRDGDVSRLVIRNVNASSCGEEEAVLMDSRTEARTIGASHGWVATLKDGVVCLHDDLKILKSDSDPKRISLPPLVTLPHCQTQLVTNVAMSSSSPEDEDCILAVKFVGPQFSLCRPAQKDAEWVNIRITDPGFVSSRVIYSMRDKMFSMLSYGGTHTLSWDLEKYRHKPKLLRCFWVKVPEFVQSEWGKLDSSCTSEELVESRPTGEMFIVKRFRERNEGGRMEENQIMVFKLKDNGSARYTTDVGDLSIFLSKSEPVCLKASLCGKGENNVYFEDNRARGIFNIKYQISTNTFSNNPIPYYIPTINAHTRESSGAANEEALEELDIPSVFKEAFEEEDIPFDLEDLEEEDIPFEFEEASEE